MTRYWLLKSEPETFGWNHLLAKPNRREWWDGVRNYQARNTMRDLIKVGDLAFFYHSSTAEPGIVGIVKVVEAARLDPSALLADSPYFDAKSLAIGVSRWVMIEVEARSEFEKSIPLSRLRSIAELNSMPLLARGQRLSVQPVSPAEWDIVIQLAALRELS